MLCSPLRILPAVLFLLFKTTLVSAQGDDTISSVTTSAQVFDEFATFEWVWKGEAAHVLNNITFELIAGTADAKGNDVVDIMIANISSTQQTRFDYTFHPGLAGGVYHARMNGTIDNGNTLVSTTSALSNSFSLPDSGVPCSAGTFTPIRSLTDPNYRPVRFTTPKGGDVIVQSALIGPVAFLGLQVDPIDMLFSTFSVHATTEVINTGNGFNAGVQTTALILQEPLEYVTSNLTLDPGSWKVRMNFTSNDPAYLGHFVLESEEFFIVAAAHDSPNCTSTSTSITAPDSTPTSSSAASGGGNTAVSPGGGGAIQSGSATDGGNPAQSSGPASGKNAALVLIPGLYTTLFGVWSLGILLVCMQ